MIRLIAIDIDGTLLDSRGQVPDDNLRALEAAAARDVHLVIVTGRSFQFALPVLTGLPDPLTLVVHNGAIARTRDGRTLLRRVMPRDVARQVLAATAEWRPQTVLIFDRPAAGQMVYDRMDWEHPHRKGFREKNAALITSVEALEHALDDDPVQVAFNGGVAPMRAVMDHLDSLDVAADLAVSLTEYPARDFSLVDVCGVGTTKGATLERVAGLLGVARDEVMAIGDNFNDRDMISWAGTGVVMGNAAEDLRAEARYVTGTNDEAGLAQAIRRFVL
ncbi:MAG: Cof-type HAD-IIB family hydrolase [Vicinamibacterales bacterium]|nr:Cof-type HAD-IIB family hydrolase [Vicinamibacterales bacterium]